MAVLPISTSVPSAPAALVTVTDLTVDAGLVVVAPVGVLDRVALSRLDEVLHRNGGAAVVIDLTDCTLGTRSTLLDLAPARWGRGRGDVCVVCRRLTGRRLLARAAVPMAMFTSVRDAAQARVLFDAGYGDGWA